MLRSVYETNRHSKTSRSMRVATRLAVVGICTIMSWAAAAQSISGLQSVDPVPEASTVKPGLAVTYYYSLFRHIDEMVEWMKSNDGEPGTALPQLNYNVGEGAVLTTDRDSGVAADITGMINFPEAGDYELMVQSNDGVRLEIGGQQIYEDPEVHPDRFSDPISLRIDQPGWYPLSMLYFERKGTSTLELYWVLPSDTSQVQYVPADALAHVVQ